MTTKNWENDKAVQNWFTQLQSERTKENYRSDFQKWLNWIKMSPSEQTTKRLEDLGSKDVLERRFFERKLVQYKGELQKTYRASSVKSFMRTVQSFFRYNGIPLTLTPTESKVRSVKQKLRLEVPSNEKIRAIYALSSKNMRPAILVSYHSGFDSIDTCNLRIEDVGTLKEGEHTFVTIQRHKSTEKTMTCLSVECVHDLMAMLKLRGSPKKGYLLTTMKGNAYTPEMLNKQFKKLSLKACGEKFVFKSLRKAYKIAMNRSKIADGEIKKLLIGHSIGVEANYSKWEDNHEPITEAYEKMFPHLSINGARRGKEDVEAMKQKLERQRQQIDLLKDLLSEDLLKRAQAQGKLKEFKEVFENV